MSPRRTLWASPVLVATLFVAGCSADTPSVQEAESTATATPDDVAATSAPADTATETADSQAADTDTATATASPSATTEAVSPANDSFTLEMPANWANVSDEAGDQALLAIRSNEAVSEFFNNVIVVEDEPLDDLEQAITDTGTELAGDDGTSEVLDPIDIDGEEAIGLQVERTQSDVELVQVQRWVERDGSLYVIVLSTTPEGADAGLAEFADILDSWSWE